MNRLQVTIKMMIGIMVCVLVIFAILLKRLPGDILNIAAQSPLGWGLCLFSGFALARLCSPTTKRPAVKIWAFLLMTLVYVISIYLMWAHYRVARGSWFDLVHGFPYPDLPINALGHWYDKRNPTPPGSLKSHGEYPRVAFTIGALIMVFMSLTGVFLGLQPKGDKKGTRGRILGVTSTTSPIA